jgi:phage repressor protein C with HTH and peptisase S24 domain
MPGPKSKGNRSRPDELAEGPATFRIELGERIRFLLDLFATRSEAAEIAQVTPEHLASYIRGSAKPPFELIARLAAAKGVSLDWLATGDGARMAEDDVDEFVAIPMQPDDQMRFDAAIAPLFARSWLAVHAGGAAESLRIVIQRGDANEPAILDGDLLLVDTFIDRIGDDALYVFMRDGRPVARFVETFIDGSVALKARNANYGTQTLPRDEAARLQVLGRVRWRGGPL